MNAVQTAVKSVYFYRDNGSDWKALPNNENDLIMAVERGCDVKLVMTDSHGNVIKTLKLGKPREVSQKSPNHDGKIGSFGYVKDVTYTVHYGKTVSNMRHTAQVQGSDLYGKLRELLVKNFKGLAIAHDGLHIIKPYHLGEPVTVAQKREAMSHPDPIINPTRTLDHVVASGSIRVESRVDREWTWFNLYANGVRLDSYAEVNAILPEWSKRMKNTFSCKKAKHASTQHDGFNFFVDTKVSQDDLLAFFQLECEAKPIVDTEKAATIVAKEVAFNGNSGDAVTVISAPAKPDLGMERKEVIAQQNATVAPVIDKQAVIAQMMATMQASLQLLIA